MNVSVIAAGKRISVGRAFWQVPAGTLQPSCALVEVRIRHAHLHRTGEGGDGRSGSAVRTDHGRVSAWSSEKFVSGRMTFFQLGLIFDRPAGKRLGKYSDDLWLFHVCTLDRIRTCIIARIRNPGPDPIRLRGQVPD